jgi:hypothetical protein
MGIGDVELVEPHHALSLIDAQIDELLAELQYALAYSNYAVIQLQSVHYILVVR